MHELSWHRMILWLIDTAPLLFLLVGGIGNFYGAKVLAKVNGATDFTPPATWYFAAMTAAPSDSGGGTEVTGGSYARIAVTNNATNFPAPSGTATQSTGTVIDFGTATANWGTIVAIAQYDSSGAGNLGPWGPLSVNKTINNGDGFKILAGNGTYSVV